MLLLTGVSGLVDAASYLQLGHVFVANMTGNIVFIGFALAGAAGVSLPNSAVAIGSFLIGAFAAARLARRRERGQSGLLRIMTAAQCVIVVLAIANGLTSQRPSGVTAFAVVGLLAAAMGVQSTTTSRLAIPGFNSTVVLTTMLSTLAAESRFGRRFGREQWPAHPGDRIHVRRRAGGSGAHLADGLARALGSRGATARSGRRCSRRRGQREGHV